MTVADYRKIWERHTGLKIPSGWHIHHIDGNNRNHDPENLNCVSPTMHWWAHYLRGDPVALYGKFIQGAAEAGKRGGRWSVESGQLASIQTKENQAKGRRNRDPVEHSETSRRAGLANVASGLLACIRVPWTSEAAKAASAKRWADSSARERQSRLVKERWANSEYKSKIARKISEIRKEKKW